MEVEADGDEDRFCNIFRRCIDFRWEFQPCPVGGGVGIVGFCIGILLCPQKPSHSVFKLYVLFCWLMNYSECESDRSMLSSSSSIRFYFMSALDGEGRSNYLSTRTGCAWTLDSVDNMS